MSLPRIENASVTDKRVFVRADFENTLSHDDTLKDEIALQSLLPTLELLLSRGSSVVLGAHRSASRGKASLRPLVEPLSRLLHREVEFVESPWDSAHDSLRTDSVPGRVVLLENLLSFKGEEKNDPEFARKLASLADHYVNEAFGASMLSFASLVTLPTLLPSCGGISLNREVDMVHSLMGGTPRPIVIILGGVNLEKKLQLIHRFLTNPKNHVDTVMVGGGISYTFLKSRAIPVGASLYQAELDVKAFQTIERAELEETEFLLPVDHVVAEEYSRQTKTKTVKQNDIPPHWRALDIGPKTLSRFEKVIKKAGTIFWYGPMGALELEPFRKGSQTLARMITKSRAQSYVMGSETISFLKEEGLLSGFNHASSSSEGTVELILNRPLPAIQALQARDEDTE